MKWATVRVDSVALEVRESIDPRIFGEDEIHHWSIPALDATGVPSVEAASSIGSTKIRLRGEEILVSRLNPRKARVVRIPAALHGLHMCSGEFVVLRPTAVEPRFLEYALRSEKTRQQFDSNVQSVTRSHQRIRPEQVRQLQLRVPTRPTQRAIADFLDAEMARMDDLITRKRLLLELLQSRFSSSVEATVQFVRSDAPAVPVKFVLREIDERLGDRRPMELLSVSIHLGVVLRSSMTADIPRAEDLSNYKVCKQGDIVINRMRAFQGGLGCAPRDGIISPDYTVLRSTTGVVSRYIHHLFRSPWFIGEMSRCLRGIGSADQGNVRTPRVNFADLGLIPIPVPPPLEQRLVADSLDTEGNRVVSTVCVLDRQIALLQERRQALITAAVTGELDLAEAG